MTRMFWEREKERHVKNFEGMIYQGKKEGVDFLLCPRDHKSKCMNFRADPPKYKHAMDMYNDEGEEAYCRHCQTGAPKRLDKSKEALKIRHAKNNRLSNQDKGVFVGSNLIPYHIRREIGGKLEPRRIITKKCEARKVSV